MFALIDEDHVFFRASVTSKHGASETVIVFVAVQEPVPVNVIVTLPADTPVTTPFATVATDASDVAHEPVASSSGCVRVIVLPT